MGFLLLFQLTDSHAVFSVFSSHVFISRLPGPKQFNGFNILGPVASPTIGEVPGIISALGRCVESLAGGSSMVRLWASVLYLELTAWRSGPIIGWQILRCIHPPIQPSIPELSTKKGKKRVASHNLATSEVHTEPADLLSLTPPP